MLQKFKITSYAFIFTLAVVFIIPVVVEAVEVQNIVCASKEDTGPGGGNPKVDATCKKKEDSAGSDLKTGSTAGYDLVVQNPLEAGSTGVAPFGDGCLDESIVAELEVRLAAVQRVVTTLHANLIDACSVGRNKEIYCDISLIVLLIEKLLSNNFVNVT